MPLIRPLQRLPGHLFVFTPTLMLMTADSGAEPLTIGEGQGSFLRADEEGLLMRNVWGLPRRIAWTEISQFTDGKQVKEGNAYWLLVIVLHTGKRAVAHGTHSWFRQPEETVKVIRELAERHGIPADLTGLPPKSKGFWRNFLGI